MNKFKIGDKVVFKEAFRKQYGTKEYEVLNFKVDRHKNIVYTLKGVKSIIMEEWLQWAM